ncbi:Cytochrome P450 709B2 [Colletotrichum sojae]|uniref:Cytochrome P450 709B2 n=1 Tax=Colletotrichum sojae TaxID=2175907 RepID=A0A8H6JS28_9PEZI|nr:Cytochrome P450 709B2 [Colletotrichum sojae]
MPSAMGFLQRFWSYAILLTVPVVIPPAFRLTLLQFCAGVLTGCIATYYVIPGVYNIFIYPFYVSPLRHRPGPKIRSGDPTEPYTTWMRTWPGERFIRAIGFGHSDVLLVTRIDAFREIFQTKADLFIKPKFHTRIITPITGVGVVFSKGEEHKKIIRQRRAEINAGKVDIGAEPDMLTYMLMEQSVENPWPEDKIMDNVLNFMVAGYETSGNTLTWATNRLSIRPDIQDKLRAEVQGLLARKLNPDYADLEGLRYLNNFCKENLRFQASGIMAAREATEDVEVCGSLIPKGTSLLMIPHIINRNPAIWGDDVDEFNPDRWDNLSGDAKDPFALATFLFGPRSCIGRVFAMLEMKMVLVEVLSKFRFEPEVKQEDIVRVNPCPALRVSGGLKVRVR